MSISCYGREENPLKLVNLAIKEPILFLRNENNRKLCPFYAACGREENPLK